MPRRLDGEKANVIVTPGLRKVKSRSSTFTKNTKYFYQKIYSPLKQKIETKIKKHVQIVYIVYCNF